MRFCNTFLAGLLTVTVSLPLASYSGLALAQPALRPHTLTTPRIEAFNVDEVRRLTPGTELNFEILGTPGGQVTLHIDGAQRGLTLVETGAGQYEGVYTINYRDKIVPRSLVTANLRVGNQVESLVLNESLQIGVGVHRAKMVSGPKPAIERFSVNPAPELKAGDELYFSLLGTPGGQVELAIQGVRGKVLLREVRSGEYAGGYTIRNRDQIQRDSVVTARLRLGDRDTSATLGQALQDSQVHRPQHQVCWDCGTVEAINLVEVKGEGGYLGAIGGGLVGAILGNQVGQGSGRTAARIAGAVGGAYVGHNLEGKSRASSHYEVQVRLQNGLLQTIRVATAPEFLLGDKVRIIDGVMVRNP